MSEDKPEAPAVPTAAEDPVVRRPLPAGHRMMRSFTAGLKAVLGRGNKGEAAPAVRDQEALLGPGDVPVGLDNGQRTDAERTGGCGLHLCVTVPVPCWTLLVAGLVVTVVVAALAVTLGKNTSASKESADLQTPTPTESRNHEPCPDEWIYYKNLCYLFNKTEVSWFSAKHFCSLYNASLPEPKSPSEYVWLNNIMTYFWIGLNKETGNPQWSSGAPFDNLLSIQSVGDCAVVTPYGIFWSDCVTLTRRFICEKKPNA